MDFLAKLFVGKPLAILVVAVLIVVAHAFLRWGAKGRPASNALLVAAAGWVLYAAWEWLVTVRTPEADIRVDLLLIRPVLGLLSIWMLVRAVRGR